ncbi:hypothetical protein Q9966_004849 [Columba livia]|nr:hypothetical protein Q9966_004849 [Columba livia]
MRGPRRGEGSPAWTPQPSSASCGSSWATSSQTRRSPRLWPPSLRSWTPMGTGASPLMSTGSWWPGCATSCASAASGPPLHPRPPPSPGTHPTSMSPMSLTQTLRCCEPTGHPGTLQAGECPNCGIYHPKLWGGVGMGTHGCVTVPLPGVCWR